MNFFELSVLEQAVQMTIIKVHSYKYLLVAVALSLLLCQVHSLIPFCCVLLHKMIDLAIAASAVCVNNFLLMAFLLPIDGLFNHQSASLRETSLLLTVLSALAKTSLLLTLRSALAKRARPFNIQMY